MFGWFFGRRTNNFKGPPLWTRVEKLEEQVAKLHQQEEKRAQAAADVREEAKFNAKIAEAKLELQREFAQADPWTLAKTTNGKRSAPEAEEASAKRLRVLNCADFRNFWGEVGIKGRNIPKGTWNAQSLSAEITGRGDFQVSKWRSAAGRILDGPIPKDSQALVLQTLEAVAN